MLKPAIWLVLLFLTLLAPLLVFDQRELGRDARYFEPHLQVVGVQLDGLRDILRAYAARHGRYPGAEEGLSALDGYAARFPSARDAEALRVSLFALYPQQVLRHVTAYREAVGRFPGSMAELANASWRLREEPEGTPSGPDLTEVAIASNGALYLLQGGEVLTGWGLPFIYENRTEALPGTIRDSPAREAGDTRFSRKVDDGIHVLSLEARLLASDQLEHRRVLRRKVGILGALTIFFAAMLIVSLRAARRRSPGRSSSALAALGVGLTLLLGIIYASTRWNLCYSTSYFHSWLRPERIPTCEALLEKYRVSGTIRPETYARLRRAFDDEKADALDRAALHRAGVGRPGEADPREKEPEGPCS